MNTKINRRRFGIAALATGIGALTMGMAPGSYISFREKMKPRKPLKNKIALNAYSFNIPLRDGSMDLFDLLEYCAKLGFDGVDLTGYYFPGYPEAPSDEYIYSIKKRAFELGLDICGTGVRNDFCNADPLQRKKEKDLVKEWILTAEKLGAPAIRIFTGPGVPEGYTWDQAILWVAEDVLECAEFGKNHGVVIEIQNHNDFLKTSEDVTRLFEMLNSEWTGLMLDIGSYRSSDPYEEIEATIDLAVSWQLKENVFINKVETPVDLYRIKAIIENSDYKGYLPIETLGEGDPLVKVERFYNDVLEAFK